MLKKESHLVKITQTIHDGYPGYHLVCSCGRKWEAATEMQARHVAGRHVDIMRMEYKPTEFK